MDFNLDCVPCFIRQALQAARFATDDIQVHERVLRRSLDVLMKADWYGTPPSLARKVHKIVREETGAEDPYSQVKHNSNLLALGMYDHLKEMVSTSPDPFDTAARLAIAGNIIDYGASSSFDLEGTIARVLEAKFAVNHEDELREKISKARTISYLLDNAGEVVFDRLFMEAINTLYGQKEYKVIVKGGPIINDATVRDAKEAGITDLPGITIGRMGAGIEGTGPERESEEFREMISASDIIISKGQGNYEGLSDMPGIYFMFMVKCPVVARDIEIHSGQKVQNGDIILWRS